MAKKKKSLTNTERKALRAYELWFMSNPGSLNPTDMNTMEKYYFAMWICSSPAFGVHVFAKMIGWRKNSPHPETKYEYWKEKYPVVGEIAATKPEEYDELDAKQLFCNWFHLYPDEPNPTDINKTLKFDFIQKAGWEGAVNMERARKQNTAVNGYPNPWTQPEFWKGGNRVEAAD